MNNLHKISFFFILILIQVKLNAQQRPTGLILEDEFYESVPKDTIEDGSKYDNLKLQADLMDYCPKAGDQGDSGACVGWATGYAGMTICRAIREGITDRKAITEKANSAAFIYNLIKESEDCTLGARFSRAFNFLRDTGDCLAANFDLKINSCNQKPSQSLLTEAGQYKIRDFARIFDKNDSEEEKIKMLRMAISEKNPVIIGMEISESFQFVNAQNNLWQPSKNEELTEAHAMVAVGYDHILKEVTILNSFGECWGKDGFFRIKYEDFGRLARYGFQMVIDDKKLIAENDGNWLWDWLFSSQNLNQNQLNGLAHFRYLNKDLKFENTDVFFNDGIYETRKNWEVGDGFNLEIKRPPRGNYVYVFSIDSQGKTALHFPKNKSQQTDNEPIKIPSGNRILELTREGEDYLCMLFSKEKIEHFESFLDKIEGKNSDVVSKIHQTFHVNYEAQKSVKYHPSNMYFHISENAINTPGIVPIILKVRTQ